MNATGALGTGTGAGTVSLGTDSGLAIDLTAAKSVVVSNAITLVGAQSFFGASAPTTTISTPASNSSITFSGAITGTSDVYISNSSNAGTPGSAAGIVIFAGAAKNYTGNTIVDLTGSTGLFQLGASNVLPAATNLIFGSANTSALGIAPLDLLGHSQTVASIATTTNAGITIGKATGITNTAQTTAGTPVLTISGTSVTTFAGSIGTVVTGYADTAIVADGSYDTTNIQLNLASTNTGTLTLAPVATTGALGNTYSRGTIISGGTLQLGAKNAVPNGGLTLNGGTLGTANPAVAATGFSDALGNLTVSAASTITLGTGNHALTFTGLTLSGTPGLTITGWKGTPGTASTTSTNSGVLLFATTGTNLSSASQANSAFASLLSQTAFLPYGKGSQFIADTYNGVSYLELQPVPEAGSVLALGVVGLAVSWWRKRRRTI